MAEVGETGTLYAENDTGALANRLRQLYESPDLRRRLAEGERRAFLERFNATSMARAAAVEFQRVSEARAGRPHAR